MRDLPAHLTLNLVLTDDTHLVAGFNLLSYELIVETGGAGGGSVVGTPPVINCGETCSASVQYGTSVLLTPIPDPGSKFDGWTGACAGQSADCLISVVADTNVTAFFASASTGPTSPPKTPRPTAAAAPTATSGPAESGTRVTGRRDL